MVDHEYVAVVVDHALRVRNIDDVALITATVRCDTMPACKLSVRSASAPPISSGRPFIGISYIHG